MEKLSLEEMGDLVRDGIRGVVWCMRKVGDESKTRKKKERRDGPARSGPGSFVDEAVLELCQPETYTVSRCLAI